jgi:hypothetical protein
VGQPEWQRESQRSTHDDGHLIYHNASKQMVILSCIDAEAFFQAKVAFPSEDQMFRCPPQSRVDIWSHGLTGAEQLESINAQDLLLPAEVMATGGALTQESLSASTFF